MTGVGFVCPDGPSAGVAGDVGLAGAFGAGAVGGGEPGPAESDESFFSSSASKLFSFSSASLFDSSSDSPLDSSFASPLFSFSFCSFYFLAKRRILTNNMR